MIEVVGWLASAFNILGLWLLPKRKYLALGAYILSSTCFLVWGIYDCAWNVVALQALLLTLNIRAYIIWRQDDRRKAVGNREDH